MIEYKIKLTNQFIGELDRIYNYIYFSLNSPITATKLYYKIKNSILNLNFYPERFPILNNTKTLRKLLINNYIIIYKINNKTNDVFILHIFHGNQNYLNKL